VSVPLEKIGEEPEPRVPIERIERERPLDMRKLVASLLSGGQSGVVSGPKGFYKSTLVTCLLWMAVQMGYKCYTNILFKAWNGEKFFESYPRGVVKCTSWTQFYWFVAHDLKRDPRTKFLLVIDEASLFLNSKLAHGTTVTLTERLMNLSRKSGDGIGVIFVCPLIRMLPPVLRNRDESFINWFWSKEPVKIWAEEPRVAPGKTVKDYSVLDYFGGPMEFEPEVFEVLVPNVDPIPWIRTPEYLKDNDIRGEPIMDSKSYALWSVGYHVGGAIFQYEPFLDRVGDCISDEVADRMLEFFDEFGKPAMSYKEIQKGREGEAVKELEAEQKAADGQSERNRVLELIAGGVSHRKIEAQTGIKRWKIDKYVQDHREGKA